MARNYLFDRLIVLAQRLQHQVGCFFEHSCAALYICKKKCNYTFRKFLIHFIYIRESDDWILSNT